MRIHLYLRNILFAGYLLYYSQGSFYQSGSLLSQGTLLVILLIGLFYFVKVNLYKQVDPVIRYLSLFYLINTFYFLLSDKYVTSSGQELSGVIGTFSQFKTTSIALLSFFPFYYHAKKNVLTSKSILVFSFLFFIVSINSFFFNLKNLVYAFGENAQLVNNIAYYFVALLPVVFLLKNKIITVLFWMVSLFFILESSKRGAIISAVLSLSIYIFYLVSEKKGHLVRNVFLAAIVLFIVAYYSYEQIIANDTLLARIERSQTNGLGQRDYMYPALFKYWYHSENPLNLLFGFGYCTPIKIVGNYAHNDWLELLTSMGLIGVILYSFIFFRFFKICLNNSMSINMKYFMLAICLVWLFRSFFSMGYTDSITFISMIFIAYIISELNKKQNENIMCN